jgi:ankyrin repeat protein
MDPLIDAITSGEVSLTLELLSQGANPNAKFSGTPALTWACLEGSREMVTALLSHGADVDGTGENGSTSLMATAFQGDIDVVEILLRAGAHCDHKDKDGHTALMDAAKTGNSDIVGVLIRTGADVDATDHLGRTALHWAAISGDFAETVKLLLAHGADPTVVTKDGRTALANAKWMKHSEVAKALSQEDEIKKG